MTTIAVEIVHIHLPIQLEATSSTEWICALSIPCTDIKRLTLSPLKWLRFVTFTVCGAKGDFSTTLEGAAQGEVVDYDYVSFNNLGDKYYYVPNGPYHIVDQEALNDRCTSSAATERHGNFHDDVHRRDGSCVITRTPYDLCDAAHIIPRRKGNVYITHVVHDRIGLYEQQPFSHEDDVDIDCVENGIFLEKSLHASFGKGKIVFLKTPNFAMATDDVPQVEQGPIPHNRTTLQYMEPPARLDPVLPRDAQADWSHNEPPSILLDFMYGAAVVKYWKSHDLDYELKKRFKDFYGEALAKIPKYSISEVDSDESEVETDDPKDPDWEPLKGKQKQRRRSPDSPGSLQEAMDDVLILSMLSKGMTSQLMAAEQEKQNKERELRSQEDSVEKVQQWLEKGVSVSAVEGPLLLRDRREGEFEGECC